MEGSVPGLLEVESDEESTTLTGTQPDGALGGWRFKKSWSLLLVISAISLAVVAWLSVMPTKPELAQLGPDPDLTELMNLAGWQQDVVDTHNMFREKHGASPLVWSSKLASDAAKCLTKQSYIQNTFHLEHCGDNGQNIAAAAPKMNPPSGVTNWYNEIQYTPGQKGEVTSFGSNTGHYTQVVWKNTKQVGCAKNQNFLVCDYDPPGNYQGQFSANVQPLGSVPVVPEGKCADIVPPGETRWYDSDGHHYHCDWYAKGTRCQQHGKSYAAFGMTASKACCACDGGMKVQSDKATQHS
jgi:hypothetical protein